MIKRAIFILKFTVSLLSVPAIPLAQPVLEQQIWTAPLGQATEAAGTDLIGICTAGGTMPAALEQACAEALVQLVAAEAGQRLRALEAQAAAREVQATIAERNGAHILRVLEQQQLQTRVMFWVTIAVVTLGVAAAGLQFYLAFSGRERSEIDLVIQKDQFRVKTAWIGVVLFAMSIALLLAYLHFVFDIEPIA